MLLRKKCNAHWCWHHNISAHTCETTRSAVANNESRPCWWPQTTNTAVSAWRALNFRVHFLCCLLEHPRDWEWILYLRGGVSHSQIDGVLCDFAGSVLGRFPRQVSSLCALQHNTTTCWINCFCRNHRMVETYQCQLSFDRCLAEPMQHTIRNGGRGDWRCSRLARLRPDQQFSGWARGEGTPTCCMQGPHHTDSIELFYSSSLQIEQGRWSELRPSGHAWEWRGGGCVLSTTNNNKNNWDSRWPIAREGFRQTTCRCIRAAWKLRKTLGGGGGGTLLILMADGAPGKPGMHVLKAETSLNWPRPQVLMPATRNL